MNSEFLLDKVFSVSELGQIIKETVGEMFYGLNVEGEVCNFRSNQSRHWYFSIKDKDGSLLNCTCFAGNNWKERKPSNGEVVILKGSLSFWPKGGSLSFNAETIRLKGEGDLRLEIEKRRAYYKSLGYFEDENKKSLPEKISTIGIVTSAEGAVIHDIMNVTRRRAPSINLLLFPSLVQGRDAEENIAMRIRQANNFAPCDVLIVCRGGGSEEDLAPYSSTAVIEAIHESVIPIISAVGHDSDFPLSDFVADLRAPTPSAAAEIVTEASYRKRLALLEMDTKLGMEMKTILSKKRMQLSKIKMDSSIIHKKLGTCKGIVKASDDLKRLLKSRISGMNYEKASLDEKIERGITELIRRDEERLKECEREIALSVKDIKRKAKEEITELFCGIRNTIKDGYAAKRNRLLLLGNSVEDLSPLSILERGYSIMLDGQGRIIKNIESVKLDEQYTIRLNDGKAIVKAEGKSEL